MDFLFVEADDDSIINYRHLSFLVLFCFSKKEPNPSATLRRSPEKDYIPFSGSSYVGL